MSFRTYALVVTATGSFVRRQDFEEGQQPQLSPAKGLRWIEDNPPQYNPATHRLVVAEPVPDEATELPYTIAVLPRVIDHLAGTRERLRTEAKSLEESGDTLGAIKLRLQALEN